MLEFDFFSETLSPRTWVPASVSCDKVDALSELSERSSSPSSRDRCSGVNDLMDDESVADEIEKNVFRGCRWRWRC